MMWLGTGMPLSYRQTCSGVRSDRLGSTGLQQDSSRAQCWLYKALATCHNMLLQLQAMIEPLRMLVLLAMLRY